MLTFLAVLAGLLALAAVSYGGYLFWTWVFAMGIKDTAKQYAPHAIAAMAFVAVGFPASGVAFAQSAPSISFDMQPFFDSLNQYLPIFISLFGIIGGIAGAMALARYIIGAVVRAFSGGSI